MTAIRQEAIQMLEKVPEDKDLNQFVMESTERGQDADKYVRELRDNDRF